MLIFLIFIMLAAERRAEMGMARAVGMSRFNLTETFLAEGMAYNIGSAAIGAVLGIGVAALLVFILPQPVGDVGLGINPKLLSLDAAVARREELRRAGKRVALTNGVFDLLHTGHLFYLQQARALGDALFIALNADASVRALKGPTRPIIPERSRAEMLLALRMVDYVHIFDEADPIAFLSELKPDVHVNGSEYGENCIESGAVRRFGGRVHIVEKIPGLSTSNLLQTLRADGAPDAQKTVLGR
jgi:rfaE bifunctional protein nucleotidyltransferase chain/domain